MVDLVIELNHSNSLHNILDGANEKQQHNKNFSLNDEERDQCADIVRNMKII